MRELYLNDQLCVLDDKPIALSFAVNDISELRDRQGTISNRFILPFCVENNKITGYSKDNYSTKQVVYEKLTAKYVQNGIEIITNGYAVISKVTNKGIEIQVLSGILGFFALIEGKKLKDISLIDLLDHTFDRDTVVDSQLYTVQEGWIYPVIDYGAMLTTGNNVDVTFLRPAIFEQWLFIWIPSDVGYTFTGDIFLMADVQKRLIPFTKDKFVHSLEYQQEIGGNNINVNQPDEIDYSLDNDWQLVEFPDENFDFSDSYSQITQRYKAAFQMQVKVNYVYNLVIQPDANSGIVGVRAIKYLSGGGSVGIGTNTYYADKTLVKTFNDAVLTMETDLNKDDEIEIQIYTKVDLTLKGNLGIQVISNLVEVVVGQEVQMKETLPDISQKDLLKNFMQEYGLIAQQDKYTNNIEFHSFSEVYANKYKAKDWTAKFVNGGFDINFDLGYAQSNVMKRKKDEGITEGFGDGSISVANENLPVTKDLFTSIYAASVPVTKLEGRRIIEIRQIEDLTTPYPHERTKTTEPRILIDSKVTDATLEFDGVVAGSDVSIPYFLPLLFTNLIAKNYTDLITMLNHARKEVKEVILTETDIAELDFFIPIYDARTGAYYYLNSINDFQGNGNICTVELIRM